MTGTEQVFVQMSGAPGSGKTTIARAIAPHIGAVVLDHDVTKSAILEADLPDALAGKASYLALLAVARDLAGQGWSVIVDSPCFYEELLAGGQAIAKEAGARYAYIECVLEDLAALDGRLRGRTRRPSQVAGIRQYGPDPEAGRLVEEGVFQDWIAHMKRPASDFLVLDTGRPPEVCIEEAKGYLLGE